MVYIFFPIPSCFLFDSRFAKMMLPRQRGLNCCGFDSQVCRHIIHASVGCKHVCPGSSSTDHALTTNQPQPRIRTFVCRYHTHDTGYTLLECIWVTPTNRQPERPEQHHQAPCHRCKTLKKRFYRTACPYTAYAEASATVSPNPQRPGARQCETRVRTNFCCCCVSFLVSFL